MEEEQSLLKVLQNPVRLRTPSGPIVARFAVVPEHVGEPWWVIYRGDCGGWFTLMLPMRPSAR